MTNTPEMSNQSPASETTSQPASETTGPDVLDQGTYTKIKEPRSAGRLPLGDGTWHQLSRQYVKIQLLSSAIGVVITIAVAAVLILLWDQWWALWVGIALLVLEAIGMVIVPRQARSYGYQLRDDDIVFRRGILWQRVVAVPYGRMQLVDITHGPLDRGFGVAQLKLVTAASSDGVTIPGLAQAAADQLRDTLIEVAETRRTGL